MKLRRRARFTVEQGQVHVNDILVIFRRRGLLIAEIDMRQKYAEVLAYSGREILLLASERTRKDNYDPDKLATRVTFPPGEWEIVTEHHARYSLRFVLYRSSRRPFRIGFSDRDETT